MNFEFHFPDTEGLAIIAVWAAVWITTLALILSRRDFDSITRLTWVVVVIFVPIIGILLYVFIASDQWSPRKIDKHNSLSGTPWENNPGYTAKSVAHKT